MVTNVTSNAPSTVKTMSACREHVSAPRGVHPGTTGCTVTRSAAGTVTRTRTDGSVIGMMGSVSMGVSQVGRSVIGMMGGISMGVSQVGKKCNHGDGEYQCGCLPGG